MLLELFFSSSINHIVTYYMVLKRWHLTSLLYSEYFILIYDNVERKLHMVRNMYSIMRIKLNINYLTLDKITARNKKVYQLKIRYWFHWLIQYTRNDLSCLLRVSHLTRQDRWHWSSTQWVWIPLAIFCK